MVNGLKISRRSFLTAAGAASVALPLRSARAAGLTVGFIYVGPKDDYGYNQAHAQGAAVVKRMSGVTVVEEENVAETVDVSKTMESMVNLDGATLLFPTSFGYFDPFMLDEGCGARRTPRIPAPISAISAWGNISMASRPAM